MRIIHLSDTHTKHNNLIIPECDILLHTGDIGGRTTPMELAQFLDWFEDQPAKYKVFIAGNHDLCLDPDWLRKTNEDANPYVKLKSIEYHKEALSLIEAYKKSITYLNNTGCTIEGLNIWGSPYSPSFHRQHWVFNADRGEEISKHWSRIPKNTNILLTHSPPYKILDWVNDKAREFAGEDMNVGCVDLLNVIKKRLHNLQLSCFGHIHDNVGVITTKVSNTRHVTFSNGAVLTDQYKQLITKPLIITI